MAKKYCYHVSLCINLKPQQNEKQNWENWGMKKLSAEKKKWTKYFWGELEKFFLFEFWK